MVVVDKNKGAMPNWYLFLKKTFQSTFCAKSAIVFLKTRPRPPLRHPTTPQLNNWVVATPQLPRIDAYDIRPLEQVKQYKKLLLNDGYCMKKFKLN